MLKSDQNVHKIKHIAVIGCGVMGSQISLYLAAYGFDIICIVNNINHTKCYNKVERLKEDIFWQRFLRSKELKDIQYSHSFRNIHNCDLIIECVAEDIELKKSIFTDIEKYISPTAIVSTITSSYKVSNLSEGRQFINRFIGLHFFNPILGLKLVELILCPGFSDNNLNRIQEFLTSIQKTYVLVEDVNGFLINRLLLPYLIEAVNQFMASNMIPEEFDKIVKLGTNFKIGPLELIDTIGIDVFSAISDTIFESTHDEKFKAPKEILQFIEENKLGKKTKKGFYDYT